MVLSDYVDKVYVINLKRRIDRWKQVQKELNGIEFERFEAFDAERLPYLNGRTHPYKNPKIPYYAAGCFLSHLNAINVANICKMESVCILEDDVLLCPDFHYRLELFMDSVPADWDIIYLGTMPLDPHTPLNAYVSVVNRSVGTWAYIVRDKAYRFFIEERIDVNDKNDMCTARLQKTLNVYCPSKGLAGVRPDFSDVKQRNYDNRRFKFKDDFDYNEYYNSFGK